MTQQGLNPQALTPQQVRARLTPEDIHELRDAFRLFDKHNLGYVLKPDQREMLKTIGYNLNDKTLETLITKVDVDNNRKIDIEEFIVLIANLESEEKQKDEVDAAFRSFDYKGEGHIRTNDIKAVMDFEGCTEEEKEEIIDFLGVKWNQKIKFEQFKDMITLQR